MSRSSWGLDSGLSGDRRAYGLAGIGPTPAELGRLRHDEGREAILVRQHPDLAEDRVCLIRALDVLRDHVLATREDDQLRGPTDEMQIARLVEAAEIAGAKPPVG